MAGQWALLVLVVAVAAGLITVTVAAFLVRWRGTAFFRYFLAQVLLFNLLILAGLVYRYVEQQVGQMASPPHPALPRLMFSIDEHKTRGRLGEWRPVPSRDTLCAAAL